MRKLRALWLRLAATLGFGPARARAADIEAELESHLQLQIAENIRRGFSPAAARRHALLDSGGLAVASESVREQYRFVWLEQVLTDVRYAVRALTTRPFFTLAVVATLSAGVGVNVVMFGVLDRTLVRAPQYLRDSESVHRIYLEWSASSGQRLKSQRTEYPRYADLARWNRSLSSLAAFANRRAAVGTGEFAREMDITAVSANFFDFFTARPVIGRYFTELEDTPPAGAAVAVLGFDYWRTDHGGSRAVLGQSLTIGSVRYTIIGVAPRGFDGIADGLRPAAFVPATTYGASMRPTYHNRYTWTYVAMLGRRKPGVSIAAADADLTNALRMSWAAEHGADVSAAFELPEKPIALAAPLQLDRGPQARPESKIAIWVGGVAVIVLLIACANVANLLLARGVRRRRELAVRRAIGGTPARILQQVLIESFVFAAMGAVGGLVSASFAAGVLRRALVADAAPWPVISDRRTLAFAAALALVTAILAGIVPALQARGGNLAGSLKAGFRELAYQRSRLSSGLLVVQTALCVVLLIGAGLFVRSLVQVRHTRVGYDPERLLYVQTIMRGTALPPGQRIALSERLLTEARAIPGVMAVSNAISVPFRGGETQDLHVAGVDSIRKLGRFELQAGTHEYFATMGTRILRGRGLTAADRAGAPQVALVSEAMAAALWPGRDPLGQCFRIDLPTAPCTTVIGIAENIKTRGFDSEGEFHYYLPMSQYVAILGETDPELFVRVERDPASVVSAVRSILQQQMPGAAYVTVTPFQEVLDPARQSWESAARLFVAFGSLALVLAALGLYAVIAFGVAHRTQEIGMRIALGARANNVLGLIVGQGLRVAVAGVVIGTAIAPVLANSIRELLFEVSPYDPAVYVAVTAALLLVSVLACAVPAARALRVDPNVALRSE